uniref:BRCT domain-containing protein n=1 Tax=Heterorhabditis bacteriophora TaxID=37862 RepID=A0A1I7WJE0_HETBA
MWNMAIVGPGGIDSPIKDFRPMPQFTLPKPRNKRRHPLVETVTSTSLKTSKLDIVNENDDLKENELKVSVLRTIMADTRTLLPVKQVCNYKLQQFHELQLSNASLSTDQYINISNKIKNEETKVVIENKSVGSQCENLNYDYSKMDVRESIRIFRESQSDHTVSFVNDMDILLLLIPGVKEIMLENRSRVCELLSIPTVLPPFINQNMNLIHPEENKNSQQIYSHNQDIIPSPTRYIQECLDPLNNDLLDTQEVNPNNTVEPNKPSPSQRKEIQILEKIEETFSALNFILPQQVVDEDERHHINSMVISVSRLMSRADDSLVHEFRMMFQNIRFEEDIIEGSTHLVMMNTQGRVCQSRSLRYAFAIARHCEIIGRTWMEHCVERRKVISTESYTITSPSNGSIPAWLLSKRSTKPLFANKKFYLPTSFSDSHLVPREKLLELISICGGIHVTKIWELHPSDSYIIFAPDSNEKDAARRFEGDTKIPVLQADWLLDSISEFRLVSPVDIYRICKK